MDDQPNLSPATDSTQAPQTPVGQYPAPLPADQPAPAEDPKRGGMLKGVLIGLLTAFVLMAAYGAFAYLQGVWPFERQITPAAEDLASWKTYRNDEIGFEVSYPPELAVAGPISTETRPEIMGLVDGLSSFNEIAALSTQVYSDRTGEPSMIFRIAVFPRVIPENAAIDVAHDFVFLSQADEISNVEGGAIYRFGPFGRLGSECIFSRAVAVGPDRTVMLGYDACDALNTEEDELSSPAEGTAEESEKILKQILATFRFTEQVPPADDAIFSDAEADVSFAYPRTWPLPVEISEMEGPSGFPKLLRSLGLGPFLRDPPSQSEYRVTLYEASSPEVWLGAVRKQWTPDIPGNISQETLNGYQLLRYDDTLSGGIPCGTRFFVLFGPRSTFVISGCVDDETEEFSAIVPSVRFLSTVAEPSE